MDQTPRIPLFPRPLQSVKPLCLLRRCYLNPTMIIIPTDFQGADSNISSDQSARSSLGCPGSRRSVQGADGHHGDKLPLTIA